MNRLLRYLRHNLLGLIAIFIALGAGAYAAGLPKNSVKSKQIKAGAVKGADLAAGAVTSDKVANASLRDEDFAAGQVPQGPQGPQGERGLPGADATSLFAYVSASGVLQYGEGALDSVRTLEGQYAVSFDRDLRGCVAMASEGIGDPQGNSGANGSDWMANARRITADDRVEVWVQSTGGAESYADASFMVAVFC